MERKKQILTKVQNQMLRGENANGGIIGQYRSPNYRQRKLSMNPLAGGNVDYKLTGALHRNLDLVEQSNTDFAIFSSVKYAPKLADQYGIDSFGLNDAEQQIELDAVLGDLLEDSLEKAYE